MGLVLPRECSGNIKELPGTTQDVAVMRMDGCHHQEIIEDIIKGSVEAQLI